MCLTVFLAADHALPHVNEDLVPPTFSVRPLQPNEEPVRAQFSKPHLFYVGSHTGCGCGFMAGDPAASAARAHTIAQLVDYLNSAVQDGEVEMFVCWEGDQTKPIANRIRIARDELPDRADWTQELTFSLVTPNS